MNFKFELIVRRSRARLYRGAAQLLKDFENRPGQKVGADRTDAVIGPSSAPRPYPAPPDSVRVRSR
jgi:hypothetical protein